MAALKDTNIGSCYIIQHYKNTNTYAEMGLDHDASSMHPLLCWHLVSGSIRFGFIAPLIFRGLKPPPKVGKFRVQDGNLPAFIQCPEPREEEPSSASQSHWVQVEQRRTATPLDDKHGVTCHAT